MDNKEKYTIKEMIDCYGKNGLLIIFGVIIFSIFYLFSFPFIIIGYVYNKITGKFIITLKESIEAEENAIID